MVYSLTSCTSHTVFLQSIYLSQFYFFLCQKSKGEGEKVCASMFPVGVIFGYNYGSSIFHV